ncbi:MAG: EamA family transporter [Tannerella sp.]|jgi:undecaprenyl phosphate-alpha-L-ara4N flippase subunit ArnE|nr:EamA family transporter [Tannerella sp.]
MLKLITYASIQCVFLSFGQIFLKFAVMRMDKFSFTWRFFKDLLVNWPLAASGACVALATILWLYILKHYEFSIAYPLTSISFIIGMFASIFIFHEAVPVTRWIGVFLIIAGVFLVTR